MSASVSPSASSSPSASPSPAFEPTSNSVVAVAQTDNLEIIKPEPTEIVIID